ncbi:MAG: hypothetical protein UW39_C0017G0012 [Parcubacteria group bacterium GW2011_GWC2_44_17]|nr:MAG: hypothetical protein UW39_C0017G0012 [Parcubacteria group bacterium GW2011_GWC2_44_17]
MGGKNFAGKKCLPCEGGVKPLEGAEDKEQLTADYGFTEANGPPASKP